MCDLAWQRDASRYYSDSVVWGIETARNWDRIRRFIDAAVDPAVALGMVMGGDWERHQKRWGRRVGEKLSFRLGELNELGIPMDSHEFPRTFRLRLPLRILFPWKLDNLEPIEERMELWESRYAFQQDGLTVAVVYERVA